MTVDRTALGVLVRRWLLTLPGHVDAPNKVALLAAVLDRARAFSESFAQVGGDELAHVLREAGFAPVWRSSPEGGFLRLDLPG